jgi:formylglycine-generating enzyme required for sulfatase activity
VVDRANLALIQQEMDFQQSGEVSDSSAQSIGQKLGAQTIVSGSITAFGNLWRLSVRALDVESAQVQGQFNRNMSSSPAIAALTSGPALAAAPVSPGSVEKAGQPQTPVPAQPLAAAPSTLPAPPVSGVSSSGGAGSPVSETTAPAPVAATAHNTTAASPAVQITQPAQTSSASASSSTTPPLVAGFVWIKDGTFMMGSSPATDPNRGRDELIHRVTLSGFYLAKYEVTVGQFREFIYTSDYITPNNPWDRSGQTENHPVSNVSWFDAVQYCNWRSVKENLTPAYRIQGQTVTWNRSANGYRLPTEAEWEYACRAGTTTPYSTGTTLGDGAAWTGSNSGNSSHPVGQKTANQWGLYDMHGNVNEWCWDRHGDYPSGAQRNPEGSAEGAYRVSRGGGYDDYSSGSFRSAKRQLSSYGRSSSSIGFRLARSR